MPTSKKRVYVTLPDYLWQSIETERGIVPAGTFITFLLDRLYRTHINRKELFSDHLLTGDARSGAQSVRMAFGKFSKPDAHAQPIPGIASSVGATPRRAKT